MNRVPMVAATPRRRDAATARRRLAVAAELVLASAGLVWSAQGLGLVHSVRSFMNDRPEWIAIGSGTFVLGLVLLWLTLRAPARR